MSVYGAPCGLHGGKEIFHKAMAKKYAIYDLHGHFLPGMDDGCKTVEEAIQILQTSYAQGIRGMFATPHYYPIEPIETFLQRRETAMQALTRRMEQENQPLPWICLGAEVAYHPGLGYEENLEKLCLGSSRYLLLEMPFERWSDEVTRSVRNICRTKGITPIIAHIERYLPMQSRDTLMGVLEQDVLVQMNAEHLLQFRSRRQGRRMLERGMVQLLGSDCHNMTTRQPNIGQAVAYLEKKRMGRAVCAIAQLSQSIFQQATEGDLD